MEKKRPISAITKDIVLMVKSGKIRCGLSVAELTAKAGMSSDRYARRMRSPEELTLKECWALEDTLGLERGMIAGMK